MTVAKLLESLASFPNQQEIEVVFEKKKYSIKEIKQGVEHYIPQGKEPEERKFIIIQI